MPDASPGKRPTLPKEAVRARQATTNARKPVSNGLDRAIGSMKDEPAFDEVLTDGRALGQADLQAEKQAP
jgi:hypothetical protein